VITPVFKKGVAGNVSNYRPISLTCLPSKIMEHIGLIASQMYTHFKANDITQRAAWFLQRSGSTCTNLLESFNDCTLSIQYKHYVIVAYIDFSKAFDSVSHEKRFVRLYSYGVLGNLIAMVA